MFAGDAAAHDVPLVADEAGRPEPLQEAAAAAAPAGYLPLGEAPAPRLRPAGWAALLLAGAGTLLGGAVLVPLRGAVARPGAVVAVGPAVRPQGGVAVRAEAAEEQEDDRAPPAAAAHTAAARRRLVIEGNLAELLAGSAGGGRRGVALLSRVPAYLAECREQAQGLFQHVAEASGLADELSANESAAFQDRFATAMHKVCRARADDLNASLWLSSAATELEAQKPVMTQAYAHALNARGLPFRVQMQEWLQHRSVASFQQSLGRAARPDGMKDVLPHGGLHAEEALPESFDSRVRWPKCAGAIGRILNQGLCGSCFVFAALGSLEARLCIASGGNFSGAGDVLSRGEATSCSVDYDGCRGGWEYDVMKWADKTAFGINSDSCVPYFATGDGASHFQQSMTAPACPAKCQDGFPRDQRADHFVFRGVGTYSLLLDPNSGSKEKLAACKLAVLQGGPITFGIYAPRALMAYAGGVYKVCEGKAANHAVHFYGWGKAAAGEEEHLLAKNSWGPHWGLQGHFHAAYCEMTDCTIPGPMRDLDLALPIPAVLRAA